MAFDTSRLRFGDMIAAGSALVLLISLFLDWYNVSVEGLGGLGGASEGGNAFDALGIGPIFLLLVALAVIAIVVARALGVEPAGLPVPLSTIIMGLGALALLYVLFRLIVVPDGDVPDALDDAVDFGRSIGIFLAFLATIGITAGGFLSARERGEAVPGVDGGIGAGGGGSPLGGGQPAAGSPATTAAPAATGAPAGGGAAGGQPAPDWYPDPQGQARLRYWDGSQWTDQTAD